MRELTSAHKVFGLGLNKTGTTSLWAALNLLGIETIHNPHDELTFQELRSGNFRLSILNQYQGVLDIPVAPYYAQLDRLYPDSKFILTLRDENAWINSARNHWDLLPSWNEDQFHTFMHAVVYGCLEFSEERFRFAFQTHHRNVTTYFDGRPEDFLAIDITAGEGWEKLCPFLGIEIPNAPFPHRNTAEETERWANRLNRAIGEIEDTIPDGEAFILVDEQEFGHLPIRGYLPIPFLERDGRYWGRPADSATAIKELKRLSEAGALWVVFAWPAFWWLDHYDELHRHLLARSSPVLRNERLVIFHLGAGK